MQILEKRKENPQERKELTFRECGHIGNDLPV